MQDSPIVELQIRLESHFKRKINEIKSTALQALSLKDKQNVSILDAYLQHVEKQKQNLSLLASDPEKYARAVSEYLRQQHKLEGAQSGVMEDNDFSQAKSMIFSASKETTPNLVLELNELQELAAKVTKPHKV